MEGENIVIQYISVWSWHIIAIIFLASSFVVVFSGDAIGNNVMFFTFLVMWVFCEGVSYSRRRKMDETTDLQQELQEQEANNSDKNE